MWLLQRVQHFQCVTYVRQFKWNDEGKELKLIHSVGINVTNAWDMCYVEHNDAVVLSSKSPGQLCAVKLSDGSTLWEFNQQLIGKDIDPFALCIDTEGRVYMADKKGGIVSINSVTGEMLQQLKDVVWFCGV